MNELEGLWGTINLKRLKFCVTLHGGVLVQEEDRKKHFNTGRDLLSSNPLSICMTLCSGQGRCLAIAVGMPILK